MGCIFSSPSEDIQRDRKRTAPPPVTGAAAAVAAKPVAPSTPTNAGSGVFGTSSPNVNLPSSLHGPGTPLAGSYGAGSLRYGATPRPLATSYTDQKLREHEAVLAMVKNTQHGLIDTSIHSRPHIGPLAAPAQARTARFERLVTSVAVPNHSTSSSGSFFASEPPRAAPALSSAVLSRLLSGPRAADVAYAKECAAALGPGLADLHGAGAHLEGPQIVLTYAEFER